ncbi:hypothetical protein Pa4123_15600 [Phytohabitans aurantiacus]|uniref:3-hydroxydecanoyl-[acyl-carrier-protein] dehydratase n=1 Tax=Phytohabitans aurantiacus TaxID=3016789 RepID=A0ABQ5QQY8_9ACTN|nr:hypothetical protein Pa4123_15600 [Phytohabitans aurantiacus]
MDGVPVLHARGAALRLVADWPLEHWRQLGPPRVQATGEVVPLALLGGLAEHRDEPPGTVVHGYRQLLASAWGRPSEVVGDASVDASPRVCRLPGPPYLMVSRIVAVDGAPGELGVGTRAVAEYDVPEQVWFFEQNDCPTMPMAVLMEVVLQPCGWLAAYVGSIRDADADLRFRNLDGAGTVLGEVRPGTRCLRSEVELLSVARQGDVVVERFGIRCLADGVPVFELTAVFGFFPQEAFDNQVGMPPSTEELDRYRLDGGEVVPLPDAGVRLAGPMLLMLDRVTGYRPDGGRAGLGLLRAEKDVDAGEWFFKCHFFQDPVWPGSLGIEAMCQLLRYYLVRRGALVGLRRPRFEPVMPGRELTWRYRGQVVPGDGLVTVEMEILEYAEDARGRYAVADAWLWVDGRRIYHATGLGVRVVPDDPSLHVDRVLDPARDTWVNDHCPSWTVPTLPMMSIVDALASAAASYSGQDVLGVYDVRLRRWLPVEEPVRLRVELDGPRVRLLTAPESSVDPAFDVVATGTVQLGTPGARPAPFAPLAGAAPAPIPYETGAIFHGPAFQYLTSVWIGPTGCTGVLDAGRGRVPRGQLNQGLLDAALHAIPHHDLSRWAPEVTSGWVGVPHRLRGLELFESLPDAGTVVAEARFAGFDKDNPLLVEIDIQLQMDGRVLAAMRMVEILLPLYGYGAASHADRRTFLRDLIYVDGCGLSRTVDGSTVLTVDEVDATDRFPNRVAPVYVLPAGSRGSDHVPVIAAKDHVARLLRVHPSAVEVGASLDSAEVAGDPRRRLTIHVEQDGHQVRVRSY